jgi:hypothetical protein
VNGNFNELNLSGGGTKLKVKGWVVWEAGDERADLVITVTQGTVTGSAPAAVTKTDDTWDAEIVLNGGGQIWSKGIAFGQAGAIVSTGAAATTQSWNSGPLQVK